MSIQTRVHAGVPAGGQFASHDRAEATTTLTRGPYYQEAQAALSAVEGTIAEAQRLLAARAIKDKIRNVYPGAATADFRAVGTGQTSLVSVKNASGGEIPPRNGLGASITAELGILGGRAVGYLSTGGSFDSSTGELRFSAPLNDMSIDQRRQEWSVIAAALPDRDASIVAVEALRVEARELFPTAASIEVLDEASDFGGQPQHVVRAIRDTNGNPLWHQDYSLASTIGRMHDWTALFDHSGDQLRVKTIAV